MIYSTGAHNRHFAKLRQLDDDEEVKSRKRKFSHWQRIQEDIARKQHMKDMANVCRTCFMVRNASGGCPYGHPQK